MKDNDNQDDYVSLPITQDTYRFHLDKRVYGPVRYENETETHVDVVIKPKEQE